MAAEGMWPAAAPDVSDALKEEVHIDAAVDYWTSPDLAVSAVKQAVSCGDVVVLLMDGCTGVMEKSSLVIWRPASGEAAAGDAKLQPLLLKSFPQDPEACTRIWPGTSSRSFLAQCDNALWVVRLSDEVLASSEAAEARATFVFAPPDQAAGWDCRFSGTSEDVCCAMLLKPPAPKRAGPIIVAAGQSMCQTPSASLCVFETSRQLGFRKVASVPRLSEQLLISRGAARRVLWRIMLNEVPEEAERGEFFAVDLDAPPADKAEGLQKVVQLTSGAGRVGDAAISDDGTVILLQANFSESKPITTHMALVLLVWPAGAEQPLPEQRRISTGEHIMCFDFLPGGSSTEWHFWRTRLRGVDADTAICCVTKKAEDDVSTDQKATLSAPILTRTLAVRSQDWIQGQTPLVYGTEHADALPSLAAATFRLDKIDVRCLKLPQPEGSDAFAVEKVVYSHKGQQCTALLYERIKPDCPLDAPLLVQCHGGPAIGVLRSARHAVDPVRYPIRHFLAAGYRVLQPLFRGTLGFGDAWAQGNIGCQGYMDGDLGDIVAGIDHLAKEHSRLKGHIVPERTGVYGGSYGGYMTLRAMSELPTRFAVGVALYGFVHVRWMTYEGGDFTWEDEYLLPPPDAEQTQDAFGFDLEIEEVQTKVGKLVEAGHNEESPRRRVASGEPTGSASPRDCASPQSRGRAGSCPSPVASDIWPLPKALEASDCFNKLHQIDRPLLLMHGEKDDICPLSQSQVVFHMLEKARVPTGLIVYPGEGHGFDLPEHQQDRDRRMLAWLREHLPPCK
eukprot:TRINITY_DN24248_c0_g1_i1.p1 TRINITY_DN24248_c0_g1~~TRINITY_DN24248_c0_g1_i1.p1  ORF type:complete len:788 (-),score=183.28 TRINITY_DN24248_c0_g1_i1:251-2614(-)